MNIDQLRKRFPNEAACRHYFESITWNQGRRCPHCGSNKSCRIKRSKEKVLGKTDIDFTLSGHTHGMQFGIEIPGWRWSPVNLRYKHWGGLYAEAGNHGWFWRNRTKKDVTVKLWTNGDYSDIKRVM